MEQVQSVLDFLTGSGIGLTDIIGILSVIAALTPTPVDDGILAIARQALNLGAFNFGQAENAKKPGTVGVGGKKVATKKRKSGPRTK